MTTSSMTRDEIIREFEKDKSQISKLSNKKKAEMIKDKKSYVFRVFESRNHNTYTLFCSFKNGSDLSSVKWEDEFPIKVSFGIKKIR